jgi:uncharacterized damage-inducible protein DinB
MSATDVKNLLLHMEWADAATWRALLSVPSSVHDVPMQERVHHFHSTQWAYLQILRGLPVEIPKLGSFPDLRSVGRWARRFYLELPAYRDALDDPMLARQVEFPWAAQVAEHLGGSAGPATVAESLLQLVLHTAHHRGQVLTRLREAGGEPPLTDFIAWIWMRRPAPDWGSLERE